MTDDPQMILLPYLAAIRLGGEDAGQFLHDQLSADINGLDDAQTTLACYCEPKGRVLALLRVYRHGQDYIVVMARELVEAIVQRLKIYVLRADVRIEPLEDRVAGIDEPDIDKVQPGILIPVDGPPGKATDLLLLPADSEVAESSSALIGQWHYAELENGIAWLGIASSGQFLPQMLGFDQIGAVNYKKGCYPGQEIVARTHYLGKVKRHPRRLRSRQTIQVRPMDKIVIHAGDERFDALVVDAAQRGDDGTRVLCVTRMDPPLTASGFSCDGRNYACMDG